MRGIKRLCFARRSLDGGGVLWLLKYFNTKSIWKQLKR
jgi:hypothetical protein